MFLHNYLYHIIFFLILCLLAAIEFFVAPPFLYEGDKDLYEPVHVDVSVDVKRNALKQDDFLSHFSDANVAQVSIGKPHEVDNLFHIAHVSVEQDELRVSKTEYLQENEIKEKKKILVAYEIFSTKPRTIIGAYEYLKSRFKKDFSTSIESRVIETDLYGNKRFIIRLEEGQKTVYIVAAHRDRLLGFEYSLDDVNSRHEEIEKVLSHIFSE